MNDELREVLWRAGPVLRPIIKGTARAMKDGKVVAEATFDEPVSFGQAIRELGKPSSKR